MHLPSMHSRYISLHCLAGLALSAELWDPRAAQEDPVPQATITPHSSTSSLQYIPPPPKITTPPSGCDIVRSLSTACGVRTPQFNQLSPFSSQASCLCYSSTAWAPNIYDEAYQSCSVANPSGVSPCRDAGNVAGAQVHITAGMEQVITAPFTANFIVAGTEGVPDTSINGGDDPNQMACTRYTELHASCGAATPRFDDLPFVERARCLCYEGEGWNPDIYDGAAGPCLAWYSTAAPAQFSAMERALDGSVTSSPCHHYSTRGSPPTVFALPSPKPTIPSSTTTPKNTFGSFETLIQSSVTLTATAAAASTSKAAAALVNADLYHAFKLPLFVLLFSL